MENNEYEIVEKTNKKGMTISKGDKSIEMYNGSVVKTKI